MESSLAIPYFEAIFMFQVPYRRGPYNKVERIINLFIT